MDSYNEDVAAHYAAYRPPLHKIILKRVLVDSPTFSKGLDIGCGTGYSTMALADYCSNITGIEPSQAMLDRAADHPKIEYVKGSGEEIPLPDDSVDIVTLAGSLFYMNVNIVASELQRICRKDAVIIPYDFNIFLDDILALLNVRVEEMDSEYDHSLNFSGQSGFKEITVKHEQIQLEFFGDQLAHLLLSEHHLYETFCTKYSTENPFGNLKSALVKAGNHFFIKAEIFYSKYRLGKN